MQNSLNPKEPSGNGSSQEDISLRLAALNQWQDEQKRLLQERQQNQRQMLGLEQRNMYKMLGLLNKDTDTQMGDDDEREQSEKEEFLEMPEMANTNESQINLKPQPKRPFLKRGEGLKQRFKISPDELRLDNLPRYKFANAHPQFRRTMPVSKKSSLKKPAPIRKESVPPPLDLQEQQFQELLIKSKNFCQSTPDLKSITSSASHSTHSTNSSAKVRFAEQTADDEMTESSDPSPLVGVKWAQVLDTQNIKAMPLIQRRSAQIRVEDDSNVSIFELLEQKATEGNFDMNSSCIRTFMARKDQRQREDIKNETDQIILTQQMRHLRLQPEIKEIFEDKDEEDQEREPQQEDEDDEEEDSTLTTHQRGKPQVRVRFSDSNDTHSYSNESTLTDNVQLFEQFKSALFQALEKNKQPSASSQEQEDLQSKANLVRQRLEELEQEIATFKAQNLELLRLKQQHELNQAKCQEEHQEAMDRVHDEKIQAEIYLHDERMKIEEERRKFDQQMRLQKSSAHSNNKKEISALKQEVEQLQLQLKQKEQQHVSAQARLRAQLRASEREQKNYRDEIELLHRENKRLEQELIKIGRENNTKMLQEINRNIARLAPKVLPTKTITQVLDENGRRTKSLDGVPSKAPNKPNSKPRRSWSRSKKKPELEESEDASSNSDNFDEDERVVTPQGAKEQEPTASKKSEANTDSSPLSDLKREIVNADGSRDIWYPNGNLKKISADGMTIRMLYFNKDIKETDIREGTIKYYYNETNTWHTTYLDGLEILEFPNGQTEHRHKNGTIEIHFPNNSIKVVDPNDTEKLEEWRYADGTHLVQLRSGDKILNLPNGQKEIHTKLNKRREYPDGTVKLVYPDGSQETRYSNGRVRLKDKDGKLIMDTDYAKY
ncbi:uncharacterized protein Dwil_GK14523 [Drosophila willistoni]|uniref:Centromere protein J C-terminal domain-containing protein n=1 Tax=Drosophila willistoni TaxID=7260 RepID=B4NKV0_DROWI|nr:interaptin [Drosophila willistoni]EDW85201.1 uncharacterized protein Dwil_GK14523 [Drosophila willistoni]